MKKFLIKTKNDNATKEEIEEILIHYEVEEV